MTYGANTDIIQLKIFNRSKALEQKKLDRINELARFSKVRELTNEEKAEQKALREEYIISYRASLRGILDNTVIKRPDGSVERLSKKEK